MSWSGSLAPQTSSGYAWVAGPCTRPPPRGCASTCWVFRVAAARCVVLLSTLSSRPNPCAGMCASLLAECSWRGGAGRGAGEAGAEAEEGVGSERCAMQCLLHKALPRPAAPRGLRQTLLILLFYRMSDRWRLGAPPRSHGGPQGPWGPPWARYSGTRYNTTPARICIVAAVLIRNPWSVSAVL